MDYKEAIEILKILYPKKCKMVDGRLVGGFKNYECDAGKALSIAISAIQELEHYHMVGPTPEQLKEIDVMFYELCRELAKYKEACKGTEEKGDSDEGSRKKRE